MTKRNALRLDVLRELRERAGINQEEAAQACGLLGRQSRLSFSKWESGQSIPTAKRRERFFGYLWDELRLREDPTRFAEVWSILGEEWGWEPIGDREWAQFSNTSKPTLSTSTPNADQALPPIAVPPLPARPPRNDYFVGRGQERELYQQLLQHKGLALLIGMAGVGKTALAAIIAHQQADTRLVFWHAFHAQESSYVLFWKLAGFLAHHGQPELWALLQRTNQAGGQTLPAEVIADYLLQTLPEQTLLLCLDDWHWVHDEPVLDGKFLTRLQPLLAPEKLTLLLTSRQLPTFAHTQRSVPLQGLSDLDTYHFVARHHLHLSDELLHQIYTKTAGNAQFLTLVIDILHHNTDPATFLQALAQARNVERYLLQTVDAQLTDDERQVMQGVAVLLGYPGTRDLIEATIDRSQLRRPLLALVERNLLVYEAEGNGEPRYHQHALVQHFYYDFSGRRERLAMHERAGAYYAAVEVDGLRAGQHYLRAECYNEAAQLLAIRHGVQLINQGEGRLLQTLCAAFSAQNLPAPLWAAVQVLQGRLHWLGGDAQTAQATLSAALTTCERGAHTPALAALQAQACRYMAVAVKSATPDEALKWIAQGVRFTEQQRDVDNTDAAAAALQTQREERALLHILAGNVHTMLGDFSSAQEALDSSMTLLEDEQATTATRIDLLMTLVKLHGMQGKIATCRAYIEDALELCEAAQDYWGMSILWSALAYTEYQQGEWPAALESWQGALDLAKEVGAVHQQLSITLNLGATLKDMGRATEAERLLSDALLRAHHEPALREFVLYCQCNLAEIYLNQANLAQALIMIEAAQKEAASTNNRLLRPYLHSFSARTALAEGKAEAARQQILAGCQAADELGAAVPQGVCRRVYGQVLAALGEPQAALAACEQALNYVAGYPYEEALTQLQTAKILLALGQYTAGLTLLDRSKQVFTRLRAEHALAETVQLQQTMLTQASIV